ncbi:glycosyltransferase [Massilia sp. TS11]|uniref:O-linked N-acetylglucosamine transferase family protein n=1 Tax=Massilia sp. TS11 TaxID=2908003 RepID=UPI001EDB8CE6|nr:glycosyltransferase [Massilia sp. TS11]MCG2586642.1 glycosyltransferase [Massilia sp. TS11]
MNLTPLPPNTELLEATQQAILRARQAQLTIIDLFGLAQRLNTAGFAQLAIDLYHLWLNTTGSEAAYAVRFNLGVLLTQEGRDQEAQAAYEAALAQNPAFAEARLNLGTLHERQGRPDEALAIWRAGLAHGDLGHEHDRAMRLQLLNNLGRLLEIQKRYPEAEAALADSLRIDNSQQNVITHWVYLRQKQCAWPVFANDFGLSETELRAGMSALATLGLTDAPAEQLAAARRYVEKKVLPLQSPLCERKSYGHTRLRIGYLSGDFCAHAVSILTAEVYGLHDRSRFEVYGFDWSREDGTHLQQRVRAGFDHHIRLHSLSDEQAARLIRAHEIDILVDLHGLTQGTRHDILSWRPAPVQLTWLGFPGPTGLPAIDYVVADRYVLPPALAAHFSEQPLYLPRVFQANDRQRAIGPTGTRAAEGLPEDGTVFAAFNNVFKITPEVFAAWMRILQGVPGSVLWLAVDGAQARANLAREAAAAGVDPARLVFARRAQPQDYLARYRLADLFLDCYPFGGGTTASDALWAGLPVLTRAGRVFASRMAGSLLHAVGLPELITETLADYEAQAIALGRERARLAALRARLDANRASCDLFDTPRLVRDLEDAFLSVACKPEDGLQGQQDLLRPLTANTAWPLVSVVMPTHCRPDYAEQALRSVLAQTYGNLEILISDNSPDDATRLRLAPYVATYPCIQYSHIPGASLTENWRNAYGRAQGEYVNLLMDDDLFAPEKLQRMVEVMLANPKVGLVTSFRQLIDAAGQPLDPIPGTERLFDNPVIVSGATMGEKILHEGRNLIGEPTTALWRRAILQDQWMHFCGRPYVVLSDVASWLNILARHDLAYLPDALSYFRLHQAQDGRGDTIRIRANVEWLQLLCDAHEHGLFFAERERVRALLSSKLVTSVYHLTEEHAKIRAGAVPLAQIEAVVAQALRIVLGQ